MSGSPFRERSLSPSEVRRITKRAAELSMIEGAGDEGRALTEAELAARLVDLGIPAEVARRAMEAPMPGAASSSDEPARVVREVELEGMLAPERHEEIADAIATAMKMQGRVSVVGNKLSWVPGGVVGEPAVTVHAKGGSTRVHYVETLVNRGQATFGFGILAVLCGAIAGTMGTGALIAVAKAMGISAREGGAFVLTLGVVIGVVAAIATMIGLRRLLARRVLVRSAFADEVMAQVVTATRAAIVREPRARASAPLRIDAVPDEAEEDTETRARSSLRG